MARKIEVEITGDSRSLERALGKAQGTSKRSFSAIGKYAKLGGLALAAGLAVGAVKSVEAASNLNEAINKATVTFGKSSKSIMAWSQTTALAFGISQRAALEASAGFGAMFQAAGQGASESAKMSKAFVKTAADLGSFFNVDPTQALEDLRSGLAGEAEPLRKFNIFMNEATIKAFAYKHGIAETGSELTENQKILARQGFILSHVGKASNDFAETSGGLANQQRILKAQLEDTAAKVGKVLLPAITAILVKTNELITWAQANWPRFREAIANAVDAVRPTFQRLIDYWNTTLLPTIQRIIEIARAFWAKFGDDIKRNLMVAVSVIRNILNIIKGVVELVMALIRGDWSAAWAALKSIARNTLQGIVTLIRNFVSNVLAAAKAIGGALKDGIVAGMRGLAGLVASAARAAINALIDAFNSLASFTINVPGFFPGPSSYTIDPQNIPHVATGGHVARSGLAVIHRGEDVIPARVGSRGGGGHGRFLVLTDAQGVAFLQSLNQRHARGNGGRSIW